LSNKACILKHYEIYINGISLSCDGFPKVNGNKKVLKKFMEEYPVHLLVQLFNPDDPKYSTNEIRNFISRFQAEHRDYTVSTHNCQKFTVDFTEYFFGVRLMIQSKVTRRAVFAIVGSVVGSCVGCALSFLF